ncbi:MAG TPA: RnfABCDGE type electron transport complex subunit B [Casimicrobiaceae bacterium]|nr:RnfABCDGE type electron transport complex subunit B [Casimicrobiaceae bacterium]
MSHDRFSDGIDTLLPRESSPLAVARIDESACIGCALCLAACPVDAIVGAAKLMHTVVAEHCIGCELCLPPCPVDCITMVAARREWRETDDARARARFARRQTGLASAQVQSTRHAPSPAIPPAVEPERMRRQAAVAAALARARDRRARHAHKPR